MSKNGEKRQISQEKFDMIKQNNDKSAIQEAANNFLNTAEQIDDPRTRDCPYPLREILFLAAVAYLCGRESDQDIATFGKAQIEWFREFIPLKNGIPSHDTFRRIFELLKPDALRLIKRMSVVMVEQRSERIMRCQFRKMMSDWTSGR
jgi:hypothetical protein